MSDQAERARERAQRKLDYSDDIYAALQGLVADVQDYPAWQRPCHALSEAIAIIKLVETGRK